MVYGLRQPIYQGTENVIADRESRHFHYQDTEWKLDSMLLKEALTVLDFQPCIDLFASRLNNGLVATISRKRSMFERRKN